MKKCTNCAKDLPDAALHCVFCGTKQPPAPAGAQAKTVMGWQASDLLKDMQAKARSRSGVQMPRRQGGPPAAAQAAGRECRLAARAAAARCRPPRRRYAPLPTFVVPRPARWADDGAAARCWSCLARPRLATMRSCRARRRRPAPSPQRAWWSAAWRERRPMGLPSAADGWPGPASAQASTNRTRAVAPSPQPGPSDGGPPQGYSGRPPPPMVA
ncbi:MAG: hypothetical protein HS111_18025 [Kofleriaceae bacterium]|nr:hypothetical protein [Kofleriaceae bacterium]